MDIEINNMTHHVCTALLVHVRRDISSIHWLKYDLLGSVGMAKIRTTHIIYKLPMEYNLYHEAEIAHVRWLTSDTKIA